MPVEKFAISTSKRQKMFDRASILKRHLFYLYEDEELAESKSAW